MGMLGYAFMGKAHSNAFRKISYITWPPPLELELIGIAGRDAEAVGEAARRYGWEYATTEWRDLVADERIGLFDNGGPNSLHAEWSIKALDAGKHVLCEKPFTRHPEEVDASFDAAERNGRLLSEAFMYRHNPQTAKLAELVRDGAIGELRLIRSAFSYGLYDLENIRLRTDVEGGALMDVGCYNVSASRLLGGEPERVWGEAWYGPSGTDWVFSGTLRFPGNVLATFDCATALSERDELEAIGSECSLFLDDPWHCVHPVIALRRNGGVEQIELEPVDSYRLELENLCDAIRGEADLLLGREDALGQAKALEALHRSATTAAPVSD